MDCVKDRGIQSNNNNKSPRTQGNKKNSGRVSHLKSSLNIQKPKSKKQSNPSSLPAVQSNGANKTKNTSVSCSREREKTQRFANNYTSGHKAFACRHWADSGFKLISNVFPISV